MYNTQQIQPTHVDSKSLVVSQPDDVPTIVPCLPASAPYTTYSWILLNLVKPYLTHKLNRVKLVRAL
jgi:hypothetical protein